MGGVLAFEMAHQLIARGQEIGLLVLLDARALPLGIGETMRQRSVGLLHRFIQDLGLQPDGVAPPNDGFWALAPEVQLAHVLERVRRADLIPPGTGGAEELRSQLRLVARNVAALQGYAPRPYRGRVTLVRAAGENSDGAQDPTLGWSALAGGGVALHTVPGTHETMLRRPNVSRLARWLRLLLDDTEGPRLPLPAPCIAEVRE